MRTPVFTCLLSLAALTGAMSVPIAVRAEEPSTTQKLARDDPNRVICRREAVTGSLVQTRKICLTRADWAARSRDTQDTGQRMQEAGLINSCGSTEPGKC